jgi:hypothetical protein
MNTIIAKIFLNKNKSELCCLKDDLELLLSHKERLEMNKNKISDLLQTLIDLKVTPEEIIVNFNLIYR